MAVAGLAGLIAITGLLASTVASARAAGSPAASSSGPRLAAGRGARVSGPNLRPKTTSCPWLDQTLPVGKRVNMLLSQMTLANKIDEMFIFTPTTTGPYAGYEGYVPAQPALCIPALVEEDGSQGVAFAATGVTQLPAQVSLASAWDPALAYQYGVVNGQEHRAKGIAMILGPSVNIQRDPRWGRNFEMFSEDPLLTSALGSANIEGIQSQQEMADVKHFATYNQETNRDTPNDNTIVSTRTLHEIYLPPFESAIQQANVASVMCAYPLLDGEYSCQNPSLISGLLNDRWGFQGFVRSDSNANASTVDSANAGLDQERGSYYWDNGQLAAAVASGQVRSQTVTQAARRILTQMFQFNLFNNPPTGNLSSPASTPADNAFALNVAQRGTVLLQNSGPILPLSTSTTKSIAVIGPDGTTSPQTAGGGSSYVNPSSVVSPLSGIAARAGSAATVTSYSGTDPTAAAAAAQQAQVAIVFASYPESEGSDLKNISLPNNQDAMIAAVAAANPNTIVVLNTGGPLLMPWLSSVKAVVEAWYPGQDDGTAIASVLFGDTNPSGHLPQTFPRSLSQTPTASPLQFPGVGGRVDYSEGLDVGYRWYDARHVTPLFPFGYGLSYTSFRFSHLTVSRKSIINATSGPDAQTGQSAPLTRVTATITNTGQVRGSDVVQLYIGDPAAVGEPPRQLEGFRRVTLLPHQSRKVTFSITGHELSWFSPKADGWTLPNGQFSLYVGDSSALTSLPLRGKLRVTKTIGNRYAALAVPATITAGTTFTAKATFVNRGNLPITNGTVQFGFPSDWSVVRLARTRALSLAPGQSATRYYRVTLPPQAEGEVKSLTAKLSSPGIADAGDLSSTVTITVAGPITVSASTPVAVAPSLSAPATLTVASHMNRSVVVHLITPTLPPGVTITPASPAVSVPAHHTVSLKVSVSVAAGQPPATDNVSLIPSFTYRGQQYPLATAHLTVYVPYASLQAAFNTTAISDDSNISAGNFDGNGNSYSAQALTAAGLGPGASFSANGVTVQWPNVAAGTPDSVLANNQTISLSGATGATQLVVLGSSSGSKETGSGLIEYTDGSVQPYTLTLDDWFTTGSGSNTAIATTGYVNDSTGAGNNGIVGKRNHKARVFAVSIQLQPGKTVAAVTLPLVATLPGVFPMHVFALGVG
jgi:beta-glucosidase